MKFKDFYNPRHVYDGFFETYFIRPFFHHYADFKGKEAASSCLLSLLAWLVVTLGITGIMMGQVGLLGPEVGFTALVVVTVIWGVFSIVPVISLIARVSNGRPESPLKTRLLGVDTLLAVSSLLFFLLGLLMMLTTLESGSLNPNAGATDEADTTVIHDEYVKEEPIFTYQDEAELSEAEADTLGDIDDPDIVAPEESFDPTLNTGDDLIEDPASDSI